MSLMYSREYAVDHFISKGDWVMFKFSILVSQGREFREPECFSALAPGSLEREMFDDIMVRNSILIKGKRSDCYLSNEKDSSLFAIVTEKTFGDKEEPIILLGNGKSKR